MRSESGPSSNHDAYVQQTPNSSERESLDGMDSRRGAYSPAINERHSQAPVRSSPDRQPNPKRLSDYYKPGILARRFENEPAVRADWPAHSHSRPFSPYEANYNSNDNRFNSFRDNYANGNLKEYGHVWDSNSRLKKVDYSLSAAGLSFNSMLPQDEMSENEWSREPYAGRHYNRMSYGANQANNAAFGQIKYMPSSDASQRQYFSRQSLGRWRNPYEHSYVDEISW